MADKLVRLFFSFFFLVLTTIGLRAQSSDYRLTFEDADQHLINVEWNLDVDGQDNINVSLPAWSPGRYVIYNFSQNLFDLQAEDETGRSCDITVFDKQTWRISCTGAQRIKINYKIYANTLDGSFSRVNAHGASINGPGVFLYPMGQTNRPVRLRIQAPDGWQTVSPLPFDGDWYLARSYDQLIDSPFECGLLFTYSFKALDADHELVFHQPLPEELRNTFISDLQKVVRQQAAVFGNQLPCQRYVFFFHLDPQLKHTDGMEHHNSCRVILRMDPTEIAPDANSKADYDNLIWLSAHEYFHLWNGKGLRPAGLGPFDYSREAYTSSLWFVEGITSYFAYLSLVRSGIYTMDKFVDELSGRINRYESNPAKTLRSLEEVSRLTWLFKGNVPKYAQTNVEETTYSYYYKGLIVGLLLDIKLRQAGSSLDQLMYSAWTAFAIEPNASYFLPGRGYSDQAIEQLAGERTGVNLSTFFNRCLRSRKELPYNVLNASGWMVEQDATGWYLLQKSAGGQQSNWPHRP